MTMIPIHNELIADKNYIHFVIISCKISVFENVNYFLKIKP